MSIVFGVGVCAVRAICLLVVALLTVVCFLVCVSLLMVWVDLLVISCWICFSSHVGLFVVVW